MKTKAQNQSKFMRVMTIPVRVLCKARDVYVKSMTDFSMRMNNGPSMALPRSFSVGSSSRSDDGEDYRQLVRAASARSLGHSNEIEMYMQQLRQQQSSMTMGSEKVLPKSSSVGMRCMGRIDEDKSCVFEEVGVDVKPQLGPRSRSYAVGKGRNAC
ncbi:PREDICTED: uncharacterized protein LOC105107603 [Populus euphratica]|uniref:Uncharacterized protein LOC105107603 n=1 Tax=Populus euphratica TaxID=75702 RepID=A0AAJ6WZK4_POPEU|nr:PREDICTED: uncharacterized protein LOC105107603 [Populus euphratica]